MKVRVLYPTEVNQHVEDAEAGDVIDIAADLAESLLESGAVEKENAKPSDHPQAEALGIEQATRAPGQKSRARKPAKK